LELSGDLLRREQFLQANVLSRQHESVCFHRCILAASSVAIRSGASAGIARLKNLHPRHLAVGLEGGRPTSKEGLEIVSGCFPQRVRPMSEQFRARTWRRRRQVPARLCDTRSGEYCEKVPAPIALASERLDSDHKRGAQTL
jgi:hypothetical protein